MQKKSCFYQLVTKITYKVFDTLNHVDSNSENFVWVLPYYEAKDFADYKYENVKIALMTETSGGLR